MTGKSYPEYYRELQKLAGGLGKEIKGPFSAFAQLHGAALGDGALSRKVKELMALAISITSHCRGCLAYHVRDAMEAGATREEILEAIGLSIFMGGGPSMVYGCEALKALEEFSETEK